MDILAGMLHVSYCISKSFMEALLFSRKRRKKNNTKKKRLRKKLRKDVRKSFVKN
ncbi:MAG: hypothetical protein SPL49_07690 [Oribacterium sp.]|nr:hypothetical protein [Oribacterium sp.]